MEIRIGIHQSPRELSIDTEQSADEVRRTIEAAFSDDGSHLLRLTDAKRREYLVPLTSISYVEFGGTESRKIGFVS